MPMMPHNALPVIRGLAGKVMALERRRDFLAKQIKQKKGSENALQFALSEKDALQAAIDALNYHRAVVNGMDTPLSLLREIVEAVESDEVDNNLTEKARIVLDQYEA